MFVLQDASGLRIVQQKFGWILQKYTRHDLTYWKYNTRRFTAYYYFETLLKTYSQAFKQAKKAHTPNHTITRHNQFAMCKQCYPNTRDWHGCQQQLRWDTLINKCVLKRLLINAVCDQRERERIQSRSKSEHKREGERWERTGGFLLCWLWPSPPWADYRAERLNRGGENVIRHCCRRQQHKQERWIWNGSAQVINEDTTRLNVSHNAVR